MSIKSSDIVHVAKLAKLKLSPEDIELYAAQLADVVNYMNQLEEIDTSNLRSTFHALDSAGQLRVDEAKPGLSIDQVLKNAPAHDGRSFVVPKII